MRFRDLLWILVGSLECCWGLYMAFYGLMGANSLMFGGGSTWIGLLIVGGSAAYFMQAISKQVLLVTNLISPKGPPTLIAKILILASFIVGVVWSMYIGVITDLSRSAIAGVQVSIFTGAHTFLRKVETVERPALIRDDLPPQGALWTVISVMECVWGLVLVLTALGLTSAVFYGGVSLWGAILGALVSPWYLVQALAKGFWRGEVTDPRYRAGLVACTVVGIGWSGYLGINFGEFGMLACGYGVVLTLLTTNHFFNPGEGF